MLRKILAAVLTCAILAFTAQATNKVVAAAHKTTHTIVLRDALGYQPIKCSATAVGPHALLTASHCERPVDELTIDGKDAAILGHTRDNKDHTVYFVDATFVTWSAFADTLPDVADRVFIFGNPGANKDDYREGYISHIEDEDLLIDLNGYPGDSGSALFDTEGKICGIISTVIVQETPYKEDGSSQVQIKFMGAVKLAFTAAQKIAFASWKIGDAIPTTVRPKVSLSSLFFNLSN